jgi:EAL domain-containing protein (putative c-di-GMP-specific phosphodiesterase class I)
VETSEQAAMLRAEGCSEAQGYLYSRPITGEEFEALVRQREMAE